MDKERQKIKEFIQKFYREKDFDDDENIFSLGFFNSLFYMQLVMFLESQFSIRVENDDLNRENFKTINNMVSFIHLKLERKESGDV